MNIRSRTVFQLIQKDFYVHRSFIVSTASGSLLALTCTWLLSFHFPAAGRPFAEGPELPNMIISLNAIMLLLAGMMCLSVLVVLPCRLIVQEKTGRQLAFMLSLPVTAEEYLLAKYSTGLLLHLIQIGSLLTIATILRGRSVQEPLFTGMTVILIFAYLVFMMMILSVAFITHSDGWTIFTTAGSLLMIMTWPLFLRRSVEMKEYLDRIAGFGGAFYLILFVEISLTILLAVLTRAFWLRRPVSG